MATLAQQIRKSVIVTMIQAIALITTPTLGAELNEPDRTVHMAGLTDYAVDLPVAGMAITTPEGTLIYKRQDRLDSEAVIRIIAEGGRPARGGPPPEAINACQQLKDRSACSFSDPSGNAVDGVCQAGPRGEAAACVPDGSGGRANGRPRRP